MGPNLCWKQYYLRNYSIKFWEWQETSKNSVIISMFWKGSKGEWFQISFHLTALQKDWRIWKAMAPLYTYFILSSTQKSFMIFQELLIGYWGGRKCQGIDSVLICPWHCRNYKALELESLTCMEKLWGLASWISWLLFPLLVFWQKTASEGNGICQGLSRLPSEQSEIQHCLTQDKNLVGKFAWHSCISSQPWQEFAYYAVHSFQYQI